MHPVDDENTSPATRLSQTRNGR